MRKRVKMTVSVGGWLSPPTNSIDSLLEQERKALEERIKELTKAKETAKKPSSGRINKKPSAIQ